MPLRFRVGRVGARSCHACAAANARALSHIKISSGVTTCDSALRQITCGLESQPARVQYKEYVTSLPSEVDLPALWPEVDVARLRCAHVQRQVAAQREQWAQWWRELAAAGGAGGVTEGRLGWALACVCSRAFKGPYIGSSSQARRPRRRSRCWTALHNGKHSACLLS